MRKPNPELGPLIRQHRLAKGMSQVDLAKKLTKSSGMFISLLELNKSKVPPVLLGEILFHLEMSETEVIDKIVAHFREGVEAEISLGKKTAHRKSAKPPKARNPARS